MKAFWLKCINVAVIAALIFMYQTQAGSYSKMKSVIEDLKGAAGSPAEEEQESEKAAYKDGKYEGTGTGYKGDIRVRVTVAGGRIADVEILESSDDEAYFSLASELANDIVERQTASGIDTVSGATFSSKGILEAAENALKEASF